MSDIIFNCSGASCENGELLEIRARQIHKLQAQLETANKKLAKAEKVIEFYGDKKNWQTPLTQMKGQYLLKINKYTDHGDSGAETAREYLKEREG